MTEAGPVGAPGGLAGSAGQSGPVAPVGSTPAGQPPRLATPTWRRRWWNAPWVPPVVCALGAALLAVAATFAHGARWTIGPWRYAPLGIVLACAAMLALALTARAWAGYWGVVAAAAGAFVATQALAVLGPGGDVIVPGVPLGYVWLVLAPTLPVAVAFAPARWFAAAPPEPLTVSVDDDGPDVPPAEPGP